jgi:hypothetical protein
MINTNDQSSAIKVFVSYTHDSPAHSKRVLDLADSLRLAGFDCDIDQYHVNQSWPAWMERRIAWADYVLVVCTPIYLRRWNNDEQPGVGLGAQWESLLTRQHLYQAAGSNSKFVPVVFEVEDIQCIPVPLADVTRVVLSRDDGFDHLRCRLLNIPPAVKPPIRTSLAPFALAKGFFVEQEGRTVAETRPTRNRSASFLHQPIGLSEHPEHLFSNLLPVSFPPLMQTAKVTLRRTVNFRDHFSAVWKMTGRSEEPPADYWIEDGVLYTFRPPRDEFWSAIARAKSTRSLPPKPTADWANSQRMADKNKFVKLLNRCLDQLCLSHGMSHKMAYSKDMRCHLFVAAEDTRVGRIKVKAITKEGTREVYKAIPDKTSSDTNAIQHWQHQAFRHWFVRFGQDWFLNIVPFWAFTSDGQSCPSRWQKFSSANMRKPEKNRAVLGHVMFWASILCREPDLVRPAEPFRIHRPLQMEVTPSIRDTDWIEITKPDDKAELQSDLSLDVLL